MAKLTDLPIEVLALIFHRLQPDPDEPVPLYRRRFLSQERLESIVESTPSTRDRLRDVGHLREGCWKLSKAGAPLLCTHVIARLSEKDLQRLETLADWPHLAVHVKKFSFLVPYWFINGTVRQS